MRLYNPTIEQIIGGYDGVKYIIDPGKSIAVSSVTGNWILLRNAFRGLVDITPPENANKKFDFKRFVVVKTLEGLEKYMGMLNDILDSFIRLDTEQKSHNQHGTELRNRNVKQATKNLEITVATIKELEIEYGLSISQKDYEEKSLLIRNSILDQVAAFESDVEAVQKSKSQEAELDKMIRDILPKEVIRSVNASM